MTIHRLLIAATCGTALVGLMVFLQAYVVPFTRLVVK